MKYLSSLSIITTALGLVILSSCGGGNTNTNNSHVDGNMPDSFRPINEKPTFCTDWQWNGDKNEITFATCEFNGDELLLGFAEDLIIERPKDPNPQTNSPFAIMDDAGSAYAFLQVNGKPFTGRIKGYNNKTKQQVLDVWVRNGYRYGLFTVWSNTGRSHEKDFTQEVINSNIDITKTRKPVIYLYPTQKTDVTVHLDFKGELTTTYPAYNPQTGWQVTAQSNGTLTDQQGKEYYALYWEGENDYKYDLSSGAVVKGAETVDFLEKTLDQLGLNRREANEFINYWLPLMEHNKYNLIHFATKAYTDQAALDIHPKPETLIRVLMVYQPLQSPVSVQPQLLPAKPQRKGFTVVEWGGVEQNKYENNKHL